MKQGRIWGRLAMVGMILCMVAIAAPPPAAAHVAPGRWDPAIDFSLVEIFGAGAPRTGVFSINTCDPTLFLGPFGFAVEGIADVAPICSPPSIAENGGRAEAWLALVITDPAGVGSANLFLGLRGFLQHSAKAFLAFTYGASLGDGSSGVIFPPCIAPVSNEGFLILAIYTEQVFNPSFNAFQNGELLYCSVRPNMAASLSNPFGHIEFCNSYTAFSAFSL